ncbi:MAG TPA: alpha/beta hydrolase [Gemmatimonadaceae bacterium]|nr:alpha/beta hydrolase [Gemmatimonadaceae bacterium]
MRGLGAAIALALAACTPAPAPGPEPVPLPDPGPAAPPVTTVRLAAEGYVDAGRGGRLWYRVRGSGRDTVLVPLGVMLEEGLAPLAATHTVIFYDPRARGRSDSLPDSTLATFDDDVADVEAVRAMFGASRVAVIGYDYHAAVALAWAAAHPTRASGIVLLSPIAPVDSLETAYEPADRLARLDTVAARALVRMRAAGQDTTDPVAYCQAFWRVNAPIFVGDTAQAAHVTPTWCDAPPETPARLARHLAHTLSSLGVTRDFRALAARVRTPVLIVQGTRDLVVDPAAAEVWARLLPNARLVPLPGVGHLPFLEDRDRLLDELRAFLRQ